MRGLDTNVLLRVFDRTNETQSLTVDRLLAKASSNKDYVLNPIVLSEFAWTLKRKYKKPRSVIADHLESLLQSPEFVVTFAEEASEAVRLYRDGPADFADYFLATINIALGCTTTLTFDKDAALDERYTLLKA